MTSPTLVSTKGEQRTTFHIKVENLSNAIHVKINVFNSKIFMTRRRKTYMHPLLLYVRYRSLINSIKHFLPLEISRTSLCYVSCEVMSSALQRSTSFRVRTSFVLQRLEELLPLPSRRRSRMRIRELLKTILSRCDDQLPRMPQIFLDLGKWWRDSLKLIPRFPKKTTFIKTKILWANKSDASPQRCGFMSLVTRLSSAIKFRRLKQSDSYASSCRIREKTWTPHTDTELWISSLSVKTIVVRSAIQIEHAHTHRYQQHQCNMTRQW